MHPRAIAGGRAPRAARVGAAAVLALIGAGCSAVMQANRPTPVDLTQFQPGMERLQVMSRLGAPITTSPQGGNSCDLYRLYTTGVEPGGRAVIMVGEIAAGILTLGLSEIVFTPAEALTRPEQHPVMFCYDADSRLVSVAEVPTTPAAQPAQASQGDPAAPPAEVPPSPPQP